MHTGKITLIKWFRQLTGLGLFQSKCAVEAFMEALHYPSMSTFSFREEDVALFISFCSQFTRGVVVMRENDIYPVESGVLTGQKLIDVINTKIPFNLKSPE